MSPKVWFRGALPWVALTVVGLLAGPQDVPTAWAADADKLEKILTLQDKDSGFEMKFVLIPATGDKGFMMGSPDAERNTILRELTTKGVPRWPQEEAPRHKVTLSKPYYLGTVEVTQRQFRSVMGFNPSYFSQDGKASDKGTYYPHSKPGGGKDKVKEFTPAQLDEFPVENVSWQDAEEFLKKLNALAQKKKLAHRFRLPTEAEWEYACRAGADVLEPFLFERGYGSLSHDQANFRSNQPFGGGTSGRPLERTCKVASYKANPWGLSDMHGGVWEWCSDWHGPDVYKDKDRKDPQGPKDGKYRVRRGGAWSVPGLNCRAAHRGSSDPAGRLYDVGFRVVCVPRD